tara:strand:- start:114 stop:248 length:135 start_codon:yes stop_codon:yes gene_type:complete
MWNLCAINAVSAINKYELKSFSGVSFSRRKPSQNILLKSMENTA